MCRQPNTESDIRIAIGKIIQETILAARKYQKEPTEGTEAVYDCLFREIYRYSYPWVYGKVKKLVSWSEEEIEDFCQEIFEEVWKTLHRFQ